MANRSDREPGHPAECPRHHSLQSRVGPSSRIPSGPAATNGCINRPDTRLHPTNAPDRQIAACNAGAIHTRRSFCFRFWFGFGPEATGGFWRGCQVRSCRFSFAGCHRLQLLRGRKEATSSALKRPCLESLFQILRLPRQKRNLITLGPI
jgi:hypothetical protein